MILWISLFQLEEETIKRYEQIIEEYMIVFNIEDLPNSVEDIDS